MTRLAAVVIGRNEGDRLLRCLDTLKGRAAPVVYVDSGSTDGSPDAARARGADILAEVIGFAMTSDAADIVMHVPAMG